MVWEGLALFVVLFWLLIFVYLMRSVSSIPRLAEVPDSEIGPGPNGVWPSVRIVAAARDEADGVEAAVTTLLKQDYPHFEVVMVNDRSSDGTGDILERLAAAEPRLHVKHIDRLPDGWLGKNHALHVGAGDAATDWILFTDADVCLHPATLRRAVYLAETSGVDHLTCSPTLLGGSWLLQSLVAFFSLVFVLFFQPNRAINPRSKAHVGIGAFNLVRTEAYKAIGGHSRIALRPDDDVMLGKIVKQAGRRQWFALGDHMIQVEWYRSVGEMARGLEKNSFAPFDYRLLPVLVAGVLYNFAFVLPFVGLIFAPGPVSRLLFAGAVLFMFSVAAGNGKNVTGRPWLSAVTLPLAAVLYMWIFLRAIWLTYRRGGIVWRDRFYPLAVLRRNRT